MLVQPYLFFEGRCEEALAFYARAAGAKVEAVIRYKDNPDPPPPDKIPPGSADKVMHSNLRIGDTQIMASDGNCSGKPNFNGFRLSLTVKDATAAERLFKGLGEGGRVDVPLAKTFFSPSFGMLTDRFGVGWMVMVMADPTVNARP